MRRNINMKAFIPAFTLILVLLNPLSFHHTHANSADADQQKKPFIVVIDPGHGGKAAGAYGRKSAEKDIVLAVSKKLKTLIEKQIPGSKVLLTRTTDVNVAFLARTELANKNKANLFISVHANSANVDVRVKNRQGRYVNSVKKNPQVQGTETLVLGFNRTGEQDIAMRENADLLLEDNYKEDFDGFDPKDPSSYIVFQLMRNQYRKESVKLATLMQEQFTKSGKKDRGVKEQGLAVLAKATMPAVLTEIGFISSPDEEDYMLSEKGQNEIAQNLTNAVKSYKQYYKL